MGQLSFEGDRNAFCLQMDINRDFSITYKGIQDRKATFLAVKVSPRVAVLETIINAFIQC